MPRAAPGGKKTVYAEFGVWRADDGQIHLSIPGSDWFHTTVSNRSDSERYHRNLYTKLKRLLIEADRWPD